MYWMTSGITHFIWQRQSLSHNTFGNTAGRKMHFIMKIYTRKDARMYKYESRYTVVATLLGQLKEVGMLQCENEI